MISTLFLEISVLCNDKTKMTVKKPFLLLAILIPFAQCLEVDCDFDSIKVSCRCFNFGSSSSGSSFVEEDLGEIVASYVDERFTNIYIRHVELRNCVSLRLTVNLR